MKRWPTDPVQPRTPIDMLGSVQWRWSGQLKASLVDWTLEGIEHLPHFLVGNLEGILDRIC